MVNEEEFLLRAKRIEKVSLATGGDTSLMDLVESCVSSGQASTGTWKDTLLLCAAVQVKIGEAKPIEMKMTTKSASNAELIILDANKAALEALPRSVLRINKPSEDLLRELVAKHPLVTSVRCTEREVLEWSEAHKFGFNPQGIYCGAYNMDCIPRCALLVGFDKVFWSLFDPGFNFFFKLRRDEALRTGMSEFALVPTV